MFVKIIFKNNFLLLSTLLIFLSGCGLESNFKITSLERPIEILGCKLSFADNFDPNATEEKGDCQFTRCLDQLQDNYNSQNIEEILKYISDNQLEKDKTLFSNCSGRSACIHNLSNNKDPTGTKENGTCLFNACMDENYHEFMENDFNSINEYLAEWGQDYDFKPRVTSSCSNKRKHCKHQEASNFTGIDESRGDPYCIFHACSKEKYEGYKKYLEFSDFLKNHPGEIIEDNSDTRCGARLVSKNIKEIDVNKQAFKTPVDVVFIIDDSRSMDDEIERVREGLTAVAPTLQNFNAEINIELHKINNVNKNTKLSMIQNTPDLKIQRTEYLRPQTVHDIKIDSTTNIDFVERSINTGINKVMASYGDGNERGACYVQRILEDFKSNSKKNLISILISDEDDHEKGSSKNCYKYSDQRISGAPPFIYTHYPFQDSTGKDDLINVISEGVVDLKNDKKFGFASIHWNSKTSTCANNLGTHAESYIRLIEQLKNHKKISIEGDICEKNYATLLDTTLADTIREIIGYKYLVSTIDKNPIITKVEVITSSQQVFELTTGDYEEYVDGNNLYIRLSEQLYDLLKNSSKIRITVTEDQ
jgi:hypothetical protein